MNTLTSSHIFAPNNLEVIPPVQFATSGAATLPRNCEIYSLFYRHVDPLKIVFEVTFTNKKWHINEQDIYRLTDDIAKNLRREEPFMVQPNEPLSSVIEGTYLDYLIAKLPINHVNKLRSITYVGFVFFIGDLHEFGR